MNIITGNDLATGDVVWWTGHDWSRDVGEAADVGDHGDAIAAREAAARRINMPYIVEAATGANGPVPLHIKERIRSTGPTVRPDLARKPSDPNAGNWEI